MANHIQSIWSQFQRDLLTPYPPPSAGLAGRLGARSNMDRERLSTQVHSDSKIKRAKGHTNSYNNKKKTIRQLEEKWARDLTWNFIKGDIQVTNK